MGAFRQYLAERFPVPVTLMLAAATAAAAHAVAQAPSGGAFVVDASGLGAGVALMFLLLFHLRVFDEHKDFAEDAATRPDRPVQRGLVTLGQLKVAGAIALALEGAIAVAEGGADAWWWGLAVGYSVLMLFEFFVPRWLERHYAVYAISHSAITSVVVIALVALLVPWEHASRSHVAVLAALALASTFSIDVLRKTWAPESEIDGVDSWSKLVGVGPAATLGATLVAIAGVCAGWLGWELGGRWIWIGVVAALTAWAIVTIGRFAAAPTAKREKGLQVVAGVHYLVAWAGVFVVGIAARGVEVVR